MNVYPYMAKQENFFKTSIANLHASNLMKNKIRMEGIFICICVHMLMECRNR